MSERLTAQPVTENVEAYGSTRKMPPVSTIEQNIGIQLHSQVPIESLAEHDEAVESARADVDKAVQDVEDKPGSTTNRRAEFKAWKSTRATEQEAKHKARVATYENWKKEQPRKRSFSPEEQAQYDKQQSEYTRLSTVRDRRDELQLDSEELHAKLGKPGLGRLLHPFRNARIITTIFKRQYTGEYNPNAAQQTNTNPFEENALDLKRWQRQARKDARAKNTILTNPFDN